MDSHAVATGAPYGYRNQKSSSTNNFFEPSVTLETFLFYSLGAVSVGSALMMVTRRSPVMSALYLILNFFALGGLYLSLHAQFIAFIQILVYAGAIMVLFVFVIMLLNLGDEKKLNERFSWKKIVGAGLSFGVLMELTFVFAFSKANLPPSHFEKATDIGTVENIGMQLFTTFLFPFEVTSVLLLAAIVGAVVLAKKKLN